MSKEQSSNKRKPKFKIDSVRVSEQDSASVRRVMGRLTGKVPFPADEQAEAPAETSPTARAGNTENIGSTDERGTTNIDSSAGLSGSTSPSSSTNKTSSTGKLGSTKPLSTTRRAAAHSSAVSPERDFQKVPNSVTRDAMTARLFRGKSKQVWDYLWSVSRGAVVPSRTVRRSRPQIKDGAGFGSMGTVDASVSHLEAVGLIRVKTIVGESGGNEYEIFTPEEVAGRRLRSAHFIW